MLEHPPPLSSFSTPSPSVVVERKAPLLLPDTHISLSVATAAQRATFTVVHLALLQA